MRTGYQPTIPVDTTRPPKGDIEPPAVVSRAGIGDGWCVDCTSVVTIGNVSQFIMRERGIEDVTTTYCQENRRFVEVDEHCKQWMKS
jgi:hypothetical protein